MTTAVPTPTHCFLDSLLDDDQFVAELEKVDNLPPTKFVEAPFPMVTPGWDQQRSGLGIVRLINGTEFLVYSMTFMMFLAGAAVAAVAFSDRLILIIH